MKIIFYVILITFFFQNKGFSQSDSTLKKMGFFDMNAGIDSRIADFQKGNNTTYFFGFSGQLKTSIIGIFTAHKPSKLKFGDILSGELTLGNIFNNGTQYKAGVWATYRFCFGAGIVYNFHENHDLGFQTHLLQFSKDITSGFFSGSAIVLRYRFKRFYADISLASPHNLWSGWTRTLSEKNHPSQVAITLKYLKNGGKNFGITIEKLPFSGIKTSQLYGEEQVWNVRLFYGIYF